MILTDREIKIALGEKLLQISPPPSELAYSSTSVDLTLDPTLSVFKQPRKGINIIVDPTQEGFDLDIALLEFTENVEINTENGYDLKPDLLVLAWTAEYVNLKSHNKVAARVEGKSSLARLGLGVHVTAPTIHAGFAGRIRLEIVNHGPIPIRLRAGMRICQLIFEQTLGTPDRGYQGQFLGQDIQKGGR